MEYRLNLDTAPASEPVALADLKTYLKIDDTADDDLLTDLITQVRQYLELYTSQAFIDQTWIAWFDSFPFVTYDDLWWNGVIEGPSTLLTRGADLEVPLFPLSSVEYIKTYDTTNTGATFSTDYYIVRTYSGMRARPGRIVLNEGYSWPINLRAVDAVEIKFVAGYGTDASDVPQVIKRAIMEECAYRYTNRGECQGSDKLYSPAAKSIVAMFKKNFIR